MGYESFVKDVKRQSETLRQEAESLYVEPPVVDISKDVEEFCENLKFLDDDEREQKLKKYIRPSVEHEVERWQSQFSHAHGSLVRLHDLIDDVDKEKQNLEIEISTLADEKADLKTKQNSIEKKLDRVRDKAVDVKPVTAYSKFSYRMFIVGTLIIGILTAWYYLATQLQIQYSTNPEIVPDSGGKFPGTLEFLKVKPESAIYGLGVVMFLLAGKLVASIYEKLEHNRGFFLVTAVLCIAAIFSSVYLVSAVSARSADLAIIIELEPRLGVETGLDCSNEQDRESSECKTFVAWEIEKNEVLESISGVRFYMTMVILFSEILLGSVAWMLASEYHEKQLGESNLLKNKHDIIKENFDKSEKDIVKIEKKLNHYNSLKGELEGSANQLLSLRNQLPTREYISKQKKILVEQQIQQGMSVLLRKKHSWETDARSDI